MKLKLTQDEMELLRAVPWPFVGFVKLPEDDTFDCEFEDRKWDITTIVYHINQRIEWQESDSGDWLLAKRWRAAKPTLLNKLRKHFFKAVD